MLPTAAACAASVVATAENRAVNTTANHYTGPYPATPVPIDGADDASDVARAQNYAARVTGQFSGTTDEIVQWASCKWGVSAELTRARMVAESSWVQSTQGDPCRGSAPGDRCSDCTAAGLTNPCRYSQGVIQIHAYWHRGTYPYSLNSTAYNLDWALAWWRSCYELDMQWAGSDYLNSPVAGRDRMCAGLWFSGQWGTGSADSAGGQTWQEYMNDLDAALATRPWLGYS